MTIKKLFYIGYSLVFIILMLIIIFLNIGFDQGSELTYIGPSQNLNLLKKLDINTASMEQLMNLNSIGKVLANRIIEYRKNSPFKSIEEIKNVKGIKDKNFEDIKNYIRT